MDRIFIGLADSGERQELLLSRANRHGLIAGATGTGKTVTLQGFAEDFSAAGVPVFVADVKGDLAGIAMPGSPTFKNAAILEQRAKDLGMSDYAYADNPVVFWDLYGEQGHPIRTTVSEMGPLLLGRLLDLNETQQGVLDIVFRFADEQGLLLLDLEDLQAMLAHTAGHAATLAAKYGHVTKESLGVIQRQLLSLDSQGGAMFFGEPALEIADMIARDASGRGIVNVLAADKLMRTPKLYATFLLWLLAELFEVLPEVGDPEKPTLVFFFDEAHLLFDEAPDALQDKIEQVVRLIRSKGVGVYFITQNPIDIPEKVAALGAKLEQRALDRADAHLRHIAIFERQFVGPLADVDQHGLEVVEVEEHQPLLVGDREDDRQHAFLDLVEAHQAGQQQRTHFADGGADRMPLLAEQVPELDRIALVAPVGIADFRGTRRECLVRLGGGGAGHGEAGNIALHVGDEGRHPRLRQSFDDSLQRHRLAGAGRPGDQPVPIGALELELLRLGAAGAGADEDAGRGIAGHRVALLLRQLGVEPKPKECRQQDSD